MVRKIKILLIILGIGTTGYLAYQKGLMPDEFEKDIVQPLEKKSSDIKILSKSVSIKGTPLSPQTLGKHIEDKTEETKTSYSQIADLTVDSISKTTKYAAQKANPFTKQDSDYYMDIGDSLSDKEEYDEAIKNYEEYIKLEPDSIGGYCAAGALYQKKGEPQKAKKYLQKALDLLN